MENIPTNSKIGGECRERERERERVCGRDFLPENVL